MNARRSMRPAPQPVPEHLRPLPPAAPARGWLWQLPLAVGLTLGALYLAASLVPPCSAPGPDCAPPNKPDAPLIQPRAPDAAAPHRRPILRVAFAPLPLSMADAPPERAAPLPSGQTVADIATRPKAIALDQLNLIAVVEAAGLRHALVRLADGRILRVREGDRLQDATVAAIGDNTLYMLRPDNTRRMLVLGG